MRFSSKIMHMGILDKEHFLKAKKIFLDLLLKLFTSDFAHDKSS